MANAVIEGKQGEILEPTAEVEEQETITEEPQSMEEVVAEANE